MPLIGDTGQGWTLTLGTQSLSLNITEIDLGQWTRGFLPVSQLSTTDFEEFIASDLVNGGEIKVKAIYRSSQNAPSVSAAPETVTVTAALQTGDSGAATLAGTAFGTVWVLPKPKLNEVMMIEYTIKWNGDTGPTYTKATTV